MARPGGLNEPLRPISIRPLRQALDRSVPLAVRSTRATRTLRAGSSLLSAGDYLTSHLELLLVTVAAFGSRASAKIIAGHESVAAIKTHPHVRRVLIPDRAMSPSTIGCY